MRSVEEVCKDVNALECELRNKQLPSNWSLVDLETFIMAVEDLLETAENLASKME